MANHREPSHHHRCRPWQTTTTTTTRGCWFRLARTTPTFKEGLACLKTSSTGSLRRCRCRPFSPRIAARPTSLQSVSKSSCPSTLAVRRPFAFFACSRSSTSTSRWTLAAGDRRERRPHTHADRGPRVEQRVVLARRQGGQRRRRTAGLRQGGHGDTPGPRCPDTVDGLGACVHGQQGGGGHTLPCGRAWLQARRGLHVRRPARS